MDAVARERERVEKVAQDGPRADLVLAGVGREVAVAHPAAFAALDGLAAGGLLAVVGRVAEAEQHRGGGLDAERAAVLLGQFLERERRRERPGVLAGVLQGVGEVDVGAVVGQTAAGGLDLLGQPEVGDGVGTDQDLEGVDALGRARGRRGDAPAVLLDAIQGVAHGAQDVGAGPGRGVQRHHALRGDAVRLVEADVEQVGGQAHLGLHHLPRRVVDAPVAAHLGVVLGEEVLVEVEPGVRGVRGPVLHERPLPLEDARVDAGDDPVQQVDRRAQGGTRPGVAEHAQRLRQQGVAGAQRRDGIVGGQVVGAGEPGQQQRVGERLGVGVGELGVAGVGEEDAAPVGGQVGQGGVGVGECRFDVVA